MCASLQRVLKFLMNKLCFVIAVCAFIIAVSAKGFVSDKMFSAVKSIRNIVSFNQATPTRLLSHATLQSTTQDKKKLGVLLLNLGGPEKLEVKASTTISY